MPFLAGCLFFTQNSFSFILAVEISGITLAQFLGKEAYIAGTQYGIGNGAASIKGQCVAIDKPDINPWDLRLVFIRCCNILKLFS